MLGAIIGDIVGSRFEFNNTNQTNFKLFTPDCNFTDDTICTVAVADALLNGSDFGDTIHRWCRKYPYPTGGYGGSFARWVHSDIPKPYNSFGNGSAMRVSPCGWLSTRQEVLSHARQSAECTHNHPEGIKGAMCIADCIYHAHVGADKSEMVALVTKEYTYPLDMTCHEIRSINTFNETCQVTVPQAIVCFIESTDFENSIRLAVSIGGDSDTIAVMTGSIVEAYYGILENIEWKALSLLTPEMERVIKQFNEVTKKRS